MCSEQVLSSSIFLKKDCAPLALILLQNKTTPPETSEAVQLYSTNLSVYYKLLGREGVVRNDFEQIHSCGFRTQI